MSADGGAPKGALPVRERATLRPAAHIRYVVIDDKVVILDLKRDQYLRVSSGAFEDILAGGGSSELRRRLLADRVITIGDSEEAPKAIARGSYRYPDARSFLLACFGSEWRLRQRRLDLALADLQTCVDRAPMTLSVGDCLDRFEKLRPWYPRRRICLFDSLALAYFLSRAGQVTEFVFGVRLAPFSAHCWLEFDGVILNDESAYCRTFQEIARF